MEKIILEDRFTTHQKLVILFCIGAPFLIMIVALFLIDLNYKGYLFLLFLVLIYTFTISIAFLKRGFVKIKSDLYRGSFFLGKLFFMTKINLNDKPKLSVLKFKKVQKFAFFSAERPDLGSGFNSVEINILNENHTKREAILVLKKEENSKKVIDFLTTNFSLEHEVYSPNFYK